MEITQRPIDRDPPHRMRFWPSIWCMKLWFGSKCSGEMFERPYHSTTLSKPRRYGRRASGYGTAMSLSSAFGSWPQLRYSLSSVREVPFIVSR